MFSPKKTKQNMKNIANYQDHKIYATITTINPNKEEENKR
jgi:hypothetical protein